MSEDYSVAAAFPTGALEREVLQLEEQYAMEWETLRRFMPLHRSDDPVIVASLALVGTSGNIAAGVFEDGRQWAVHPLLFGRAALGVWRPGVTEAGMSDDVWDFSNPVIAVLAATEWAGFTDEPRWWSRHAGTGRRRLYLADGRCLQYRLED